MNHVVRSRVSLSNSAKQTGHGVFLQQPLLLGAESYTHVAQTIRAKSFFIICIVVNVIL